MSRVAGPRRESGRAELPPNELDQLVAPNGCLEGGDRLTCLLHARKDQDDAPFSAAPLLIASDDDKSADRERGREDGADDPEGLFHLVSVEARRVAVKGPTVPGIKARAGTSRAGVSRR